RSPLSATPGCVADPRGGGSRCGTQPALERGPPDSRDRRSRGPSPTRWPTLHGWGRAGGALPVGPATGTAGHRTHPVVRRFGTARSAAGPATEPPALRLRSSPPGPLLRSDPAPQCPAAGTSTHRWRRDVSSRPVPAAGGWEL